MASFLSSIFNRNERTKVPIEVPLFPPAGFSMLQAEADGKAVTGSVNKGYKDYGRKAEFPWCLHIGIALLPDGLQSNGLPKDEEIETAFKLEDELVDEVKKKGTAHYIGHLFNDGYLDVYVYLSAPEQVHEYLQTQINKIGLLRAFGYEINKDEDWDSVAGFLQ